MLLRRLENGFFIFIIGFGIIGLIGLVVPSITTKIPLYKVRDTVQQVTLYWGIFVIFGMVIHEGISRYRTRPVVKKHIRLFKKD